MTHPILGSKTPPEEPGPPPSFPNDPEPNPIPDRPDHNPFPDTPERKPFPDSPEPKEPPIKDPDPPQIDW